MVDKNELDSLDDEIHDDMDFDNDESLKESNALSSHKDDYFDDDIAMLSDDEVLYSDKMQSVIKQSDNVVHWEITNLYDDYDKMYSPRELKAKNPILVISSYDKEDEFMALNLTPQLAKELSNTMNMVHKAYFGVTPNDSKPLTQEHIKERAQDFKQWLATHPVKTSIIGFVMLVVLFYSFLW